MVKGVNKTIIEVNDTGSRLFEKIVFYVTPEYGNVSAKRLQKAACEFSFNFEEARFSSGTLRKRVKAKNRGKGIIFILGLAGLAIISGIILLIIL